MTEDQKRELMARLERLIDEQDPDQETVAAILVEEKLENLARPAVSHVANMARLARAHERVHSGS